MRQTFTFAVTGDETNTRLQTMIWRSQKLEDGPKILTVNGVGCTAEIRELDDTSEILITWASGRKELFDDLSDRMSMLVATAILS